MDGWKKLIFGNIVIFYLIFFTSEQVCENNIIDIIEVTRSPMKDGWLDEWRDI